MRVGLASDSWETRHGAALALRASIRGIAAFYSKSGRLPAEVTDTFAANIMDIAVRALCALAQERFADFSDVSAVSPVREMCSQVLTVGASCLATICDSESTVRISGLVDTLRNLARYGTEWDVRHAGLVALKYLSLSLLRAGSALGRIIKVRAHEGTYFCNRGRCP